MDTNLKKSKLIKAFICRIIMVTSFVTMIATGIFGREALTNLTKEGNGTLSGDIYYLTEMREYMAALFHDYMIGNVGIADDLGYPLTDESAYRYEVECRNSFEQVMKMTPDALVYQYQQLRNSSSILQQDGNIITPLYSENDGHLLENDDFKIAVYWDGPQNKLYFFDRVYNIPSPGAEYLTKNDYSPAWEASTRVRFVLGYKEAGLSEYETFRTMRRTAEGYQSVLTLFFTSAGLFVLFGLFSLFSRRNFARASALYHAFSRKVFLEIKLVLLISMVHLWWSYDLNVTLGSLRTRLYIYPDLWIYYPVTALLYLLWLDFRYAPRQFLTNCFIYKAIRALSDIYKSAPWKKKIQSICLVLFFSILVTIFAIFYAVSNACALIALVILLIFQCLSLTRLYHFVQDTNAILKKVDDLSQGNRSEGTRLSRKTLLGYSALALEELQNGIEKAVEQENKANRMRVELITNVSHDLKTPLTSIINYADLLSEEELAAPASEYVEALRSKAYRLKKMVQDVFELSKATTGNLPVEKTKLDLAKLVKQTLGDMDETLQNSSLQFKLKISAEPLFIMADGEKMYRVFQNLLVNAMQYSLPGSRVHIELEESNGYAVAKMKNVSLEEMNFDPDEIVERFVRADSSRTKEGSGLGLSIVQSFTQACGGEFSISLDADLFTACIRFPLIHEQEGTTDDQTMEEL